MDFSVGIEAMKSQAEESMENLNLQDVFFS
jgi:hypothetical protein